MTLQEIRIRELSASVESYRQFLSSKQQELDSARQQVVRIGQELGGEEFDELLKNRPNGETAVADLASRIIDVVRARSGSWNASADVQQVRALSSQIEELKRQIDVQTRRAAAAEEEVGVLKKQVSTYEASLADERKRNKDLSTLVPAVINQEDTLNYEAWYKEWSRSNAFERSCKVVTLVGDTGTSRKSELQRELEIRLNMKRRNTYNVIDECEGAGLIKSEKGASTLGRPTDVLFLTPLGEWVYSKLTGKTPQKSEYPTLLKAHKSSHHVAMILKVADLFSNLGFEVEREPTQIKIAENRYYQPDLVAKKESETFYLEVETGERFDRSSLLRKWENAFIAGGGQICLVAPNSGLMNNYQSQINAWATDNGKKVTVCLTNLEALRKLNPDASPWARVRRVGSA